MQRFEKVDSEFDGKKGTADLVVMQNHLACPGQHFSAAFFNTISAVEPLREEGFRERFEYLCRPGLSRLAICIGLQLLVSHTGICNVKDR